MSVAVDGPAARIVVALDVDELDQAVALARRLSGRVGWLKVGLELFTREGPRAVAAIAEHAPVFLDLKLHDIQTTVARSVASVARLDAGCSRSMRRAARRCFARRPTLPGRRRAAGSGCSRSPC